MEKLKCGEGGRGTSGTGEMGSRVYFRPSGRNSEGKNRKVVNLVYALEKNENQHSLID